MRLAAWLDREQRRHPWLGFPLGVAYKFFDDQGGYLAALLTYYAFVSIFPLLLIFTTAVGIVLANNVELQNRILESALSQFPVIGEQLSYPERLSGGAVGLTVGILGALFGGLGVAVALQNAMNVAWSVPRNRRPDPIMARVRGLVLLLTAGTALLGLMVLSRIGALLDTGPWQSLAITLGAILLNSALFAVVFRFAPARSLRFTDVLPGAVAAAVGWQMLQDFGTLYVNTVVRNSSLTNSIFAVVLGMLALLYLAANIVVMCVEVNVVRVQRLYPRSLLTPFTDNVELTRGDRRSYTRQAQAQRHKDFQNIEVTFDKRPRP
ncbi:MAG TPA: YihY/virulence factor BrkB family protein [Aldersonia sp.]